MKITLEKKNNWLIYQVHGEVDSFTYPILAKELNVILRSGQKNIVMDLSNSERLNLTAYLFLAKSLNTLTDNDGRFYFYGASDEMIEILKLFSGRSINIFENKEKFEHGI